MSQSESVIITCNLLKARGKSCVQGANSFGFVPLWLKNCHLIFKPITKLSNRNGVVASDSHLKTNVRIGNDPIQQFQSLKYSSIILMQFDDLAVTSHENVRSILRVATRDLVVTSPKIIQKATCSRNFLGRHQIFSEFPPVIIVKLRL